MRLKSIEFGRLMKGLHVRVVRVIDKPDGRPGDPKEFVEFFVKNGSLTLDYRLTEDETKILIKMLTGIIEA